MAQPVIDMSELLDAIEQFDSRLTAYDSAQSEFELCLDSDQLIAEIDKSSDYRTPRGQSSVVGGLKWWLSRGGKRPFHREAQIWVKQYLA